MKCASKWCQESELAAIVIQLTPVPNSSPQAAQPPPAAGEAEKRRGAAELLRNFNMLQRRGPCLPSVRTHTIGHSNKAQKWPTKTAIVGLSVHSHEVQALTPNAAILALMPHWVFHPLLHSPPPPPPLGTLAGGATLLRAGCSSPSPPSAVCSSTGSRCSSPRSPCSSPASRSGRRASISPSR